MNFPEMYRPFKKGTDPEQVVCKNSSENVYPRNCHKYELMCICRLSLEQQKSVVLQSRFRFGIKLVQYGILLCITSICSVFIN